MSLLDTLVPAFWCIRSVLLVPAVAIGLSGLSGAAKAQSGEVSYSLYGVPGLIDMPTAEAAPDADLAVTLGGFDGDLRTTLTFQALPFLSGSFRLNRVDQTTFSGDPNAGNGTTSDRSFDVRLQLLQEGALTPSIAIGLQDFAGTGKLAGEYLVATKSLSRNVMVTAGLGWGRLGSNNTIGAIGTRPTGTGAEGGVPESDEWFRGDYAPFGGLAWQVNDRLRLAAEYSSDAYDNAVAGDALDRETSWNFGVDYRFPNRTQLSVYALYGSEIAAQLTFVINPKETGAPTGVEEAPLPLIERPEGRAHAGAWTVMESVNYEAALQDALDRDGLVVVGFKLAGQTATLLFENPRFQAESQSIGRAARAMARTLPASVEVFEIVPTAYGLSLSTVTLRRRDLESYEFDAAEDLRPRVAIADAFATDRIVSQAAFPRFGWSLAPYVATGLFDVERPFRADLGLRAEASYRPGPATKISGAVTERLVGNLDDTPAFAGTGELPSVRTDFPIYLREGYPGVEYLTVARFGRPGRDLYSRVTAGYLESMFGGLSGEVLWKRVDSPFALGAELNFVRQREFDRLFGFRDYEVTTGHVSAYYDFGNGFQGQIDAGRYLAGDVGATFTLNREFANGWQVGAFATFTDASAEEFGEGSFDKGIILRIPISYVLGTADRSVIDADLRPILRNGGARLNVRDRLYPSVRDYHEGEIDESFGRFWR